MGPLTSGFRIYKRGVELLLPTMLEALILYSRSGNTAPFEVLILVDE